MTVDGEPVNPPDSGAAGSGDELREIRLELKLCKALVELRPSDEISRYLYARIADLLRTMRRHDAIDEDCTQPADLTDAELKEATAIIRAMRALPSAAKGYPGGTGLRVVLGGYALDLADEISARTERCTQPQP
jgi:hypothetical protein